MKEKLNQTIVAVALLLTLGLSQQVEAKCVSGKTFIGADKTEYCVSNVTMTWWSAFTWCQAQGRHLATWAEACPESTVGATCANIRDAETPDWVSSASSSPYGWTAEPRGNDAAYYVNLSSGAVYNYLSLRNYNFYALCK